MDTSWYVFIYSFLSGHWLRVFVICLAGFIIALLSIFSSYLLKILVDIIANYEAVTNSSNDTNIITIISTFVGINFCISILWGVGSYADLKLFPFVKAKIYAKTFEYISNQNHEFFQNNLAGDLSNKINDLTESVEGILVSLFYIVNAFFFVMISIYMYATVSAYFAVVVFSWVIFFIFISFVLSKKVKNYSAEHASANSFLSGQCVNILMNMFNINLFMRHDYETKNLNHFCYQVAEKDVLLRWKTLKVLLSQGISYALIIGIVVIILYYFFLKGILTSGDFVFIISNTTNISYIIFGLSDHITKIIDKIGVLNQAISVLYLPYSLYERKNAPDLKITNGRIDFKNVSFGYKKNKQIFESLNITIFPGEIIGIIGYSGSGKTTFVNLLLRLYDVEKGGVFIDNQDIKETALKSLRQNISMIPQNPILFNRSFKENIGYAKAEAKPNEIIAAAKKAYIHDCITNTYNGYDSIIGENGIKLSGGEQQRVAIARAVLKNAPIVILDEATSGLDLITEIKIEQSIKKFIKGKTTIIIAHKINTILSADRILVFDNGKIVGNGNHSELLVKCELYSRMWSTQKKRPN